MGVLRNKSFEDERQRRLERPPSREIEEGPRASGSGPMPVVPRGRATEPQPLPPSMEDMDKYMEYLHEMIKKPHSPEEIEDLNRVFRQTFNEMKELLEYAKNKYK
ncbi:uncharacterized protein LOC110382967 [Helicoverpa armigera]|uniref:Uncharacterized protein n=1 Tax=Helicoverpa armigera TaxID=29058 RepID=A0A2W1BDI4_HELAM|nr:uncharacterized protein LOC124644220 [Helicoverpa zea]XP_049704324.1 uncharacterized protein LOC110382967 isoform X2 [Helicoverpa armigera]PZC70996.1 hypothetical protein B5X24_HaOG214487 [Helicoverpa armigera]